MLVGLRSRWKAPVAYYLSRGLSAETQTQLLLHCLEKLQEIGIQVHCLTMDGHACNTAMCSKLGARIATQPGAEIKPYFTMPSSDSKIYILFDPCHMIKLVRNLLDAYKIIKSPSGKYYGLKCKLI